ncbi:MAG: TVP38/TMEM64 family protein, partial [Treponema sp.]|nr:TVP38/TMEM64 family protein [Treponema sp.]
MQKTTRRFIIFLVLFVTATGILGFAFWPLIKHLQNPEYRAAFTAWVTGLGAWGIFILLGLQMLQIVVAVIPGGPMELIAGAAYGTWKGILILE